MSGQESGHVQLRKRLVLSSASLGRIGGKLWLEIIEIYIGNKEISPLHLLQLTKARERLKGKGVIIEARPRNIFDHALN